MEFAKISQRITDRPKVLRVQMDKMASEAPTRKIEIKIRNLLRRAPSRTPLARNSLGHFGVRQIKFWMHYTSFFDSFRDGQTPVQLKAGLNLDF